ncbi:DUF21-domain-containing protein [Coemansia reversa NRRL 1564]|uniref:DUF21-domain-containing protein n=1 Tax=Coemansia reversa (strain ATCC 12441 / NRRL 1564) TaxID=763665 RepID=A0A2G5BL56_COERN|nr:DUF21-domain-containing protein [Coemansia reversa NRRL 1564]|eukprot:PIA19736.1 DUF21-domain-containing protein [Coemansia reversa NRRL 1564]
MDPPLRSSVKTAVTFIIISSVVAILPVAHAHPIQNQLSSSSSGTLGEAAATSSYYIQLVACAVLVVVGGLLAGLTLGLMSLDEINLQILATSGSEKQRQYAKRIQPIRKNGHWLLVTLLLGNTVVNETLPIVMDSVLGGGGVSAIVISTAAIVLFGEIIPQSLCARYGLAIGAFFAYPVRLLQYVLAPLGYPIAMLLDYVLGPDHGVIYKKAQLKELVLLSDTAHGGNLSTDEVTIIRGALELSEKLVADVMTDLHNVFMVDISAQLDRQLLTEMVRRGHSRVPVFDGRRDNIVGVLLVKSLVLLDPDDCTPVRDATIAPIPLVTTRTSLYDILNAFQEGGSHMAVVVSPPPHQISSRPDAHVTDGRDLSLPSNCSSSSTLAACDAGSAVTAATPLLQPPHVRNVQGASTYLHPSDYAAGAAQAATAASEHVPIGIITLEDVIEELIQEEIIDETDEFIDMRKRIRVVRATVSTAPTTPAATMATSAAQKASHSASSRLLATSRRSDFSTTNNKEHGAYPGRAGLAFSTRRRNAYKHEKSDTIVSAQAIPRSLPSSSLSDDHHSFEASTKTPLSCDSDARSI